LEVLLAIHLLGRFIPLIWLIHPVVHLLDQLYFPRLPPFFHSTLLLEATAILLLLLYKPKLLSLPDSHKIEVKMHASCCAVISHAHDFSKAQIYRHEDGYKYHMMERKWWNKKSPNQGDNGFTSGC
jgi:hypothetical protein